MKSVISVLVSRWLLSFVGTALLAVLIWFFGPLVPYLGSRIVRLAIVVAMLLVWLLVNVLIDVRARRREKALTDGVTAAKADPTVAAKADEVAALRERLTTALALLKKARGTRGYLYEQPCYAIIGPPGAGKTTALLNAGLQFPLAAEMGQGAVAGVGGTRLCDWWFTDDAVLIDTAGRYTTQDSDAQVDRAGWEEFLDLLKRTRPRQPLNGVLVAIALSDIAGASEAERKAHVHAVRQRIKELDTRLGVRMPVYLLFTKADLIAGFTEFFEDLDREKRAQVWGTTFPLAMDETGAAAAFAPEFRALVNRLDMEVIEKLQASRGADRAALIAGFPAQVASMEPPLTEFIDGVFSGSKLDRAPFLRGVYFTSGTQEGTPVDRLTGALSRAFGLDQRRMPSLRPEQGRSYFLTKLLRDVVFGEAMLVSERPGAVRRRMLLRAGAFAAVFLLVLGAGALLWHSRTSGSDEIAATDAALTAYEQAAQGLPLDPVADADLPRLVPLLDRARALPFGYDRARAGNAGALGFGLSQTAKLGAAARTVYRHALDNALLPRLIWRLEAQMRGRLNDPDFLYPATRVYLMLGNAGPLDRGLVHDWMMLDWQAAYPGATAAPLRQSLLRHLDALLAEPLPSVQLDGDLVAKARSTFSRVPLAQRVYSRIRPSAAAQAIPPWRPRDALGPAGVGVFIRASGKPMDEGIPGFFTIDGFHRVLLPSLGGAAESVAAESWVLGKRQELDPNGPEMRALERDVIALYEADYIAAWDAILNDLDVVPLRSLSQAAQDLYILASPQSPMRDLLASIARQVTLSVPPEGMAKPGAATAPGATANPAATAATSQLSPSLFGSTAPGQAPPPPPGSEVDEHFKALRTLVGTGPGAPIDLVLKSLNDLQQELAKMAAVPIGTTAPAPAPGDDPSLALRAEAQRQPQPLSRWLASMATGGTALRGGNAKQQMVAAFNGAGGAASLCALAVNGRYPFTPSSANDVPLDDFTRLFAPGGLLDGFFNTQLRPYVVTSEKVWRLQPVDGVTAPITPNDLMQFQRAATIRDLFFAGGGTTPSVRFDITPTELDSGAKQATLDFDGTTVVSEHGPPRATQITWPGPNHMQTVRLSFNPPPTSGAGALQDTGPWAMFRMFGRARLVPGSSPERYTLTFQVGGREAGFEIRAGSILNPFAPGVLQDFRCPAVQ
jgi:type VI secretion system protein ImpL